MRAAVDLTSLLSVEPGQTVSLDWFVSSALFAAGVWDSPRTSDGIPTTRVLERGPACLRVAGRIYEIDDQSLHSFWLELHASSSVSWSLYFDVMNPSSRRARDAIHSYLRAEDIEWRVTLAGEATIVDGKLSIINESIRASVQDVPEAALPPPPRGRGRRC